MRSHATESNSTGWICQTEFGLVLHVRVAAPGIWQYCDWITFCDEGSCTISGRPDATLNHGEIRPGTAKIYAPERLSEIRDSLVIHLSDTDARELVPSRSSRRGLPQHPRDSRHTATQNRHYGMRPTR